MFAPVVRRFVIACHEVAERLHGQVLVEELARQIAQHRLVFAESEVLRRFFAHRSALYFDFARPSTRSPRMLR